VPNVPAAPSPVADAISKAIAPTPDVPQISGPSPQLALPAPETPVRPQIAAPPEVPQVEGPTPRLALPAPSQIPQTDLKAPPISPANPVVQTPLSRAGGRIGAGVATGAARGGVPGAIVGGAASAAPELYNLGKYIAKNLHLS
jgi:hypothetical protein